MDRFYRICHRLLAGPIRLIFRIKVTGRENEPDPGAGGYLVCANHMSAWDPVWLGAAFRKRQLHYMAKEELFKIPLLRGLIRALGAYPVQRGAADTASIKNTISILTSGKCVGIFPQGTRHRGVNPLDTEVRSGVGMIAHRAGADVLPVFIKAKDNISSPFARKEIIIGKPIPHSEIEKMREAHTGYREIAEFIFSRICILGGLERKEGNDSKQ